jgi:two-component system sensor histidine kinase BaeS
MVGALSYRKERIDVADVLEQAIEPFAARFSERGLRIEKQLPAGLKVMADADRLGQTFRNLLENSARYTDAGGRLRISRTRRRAQSPSTSRIRRPACRRRRCRACSSASIRVEGSRSRANGGAGPRPCHRAQRRSTPTGEPGSRQLSPLGGLRVSIGFRPHEQRSSS